LAFYHGGGGSGRDVQKKTILKTKFLLCDLKPLTKVL
jgi:hypothetical protein